MVNSGRFGVGGAGHRYWRVRNTTSQTFFGLHDLQFRTALGGPDVATGGTAIASSEYDSQHLDDYAFDVGGYRNFWSTLSGSGTNGWIGYDFGSNKDIIEVAFWTNDASRLPGTFEVQYSDDSSSWTTLFTQTVSSPTANTLYVANASGISTSGMWVRVRALATPPGGGGYMSYDKVVFDGINSMMVDTVSGSSSAIASSSFGGFPPANAFDGANFTYWITAAPATSSDYIACKTDAQSASEITSVTLKASSVAGEGGRVPTQFAVETAPDSAGSPGSWTTYASKTVSAFSDGEERTISLP